VANIITNKAIDLFVLFDPLARIIVKLLAATASRKNARDARHKGQKNEGAKML